MTLADLENLVKKGSKIERLLAAANIPSQIESNKTTAVAMIARII
jgi:hypothetical protein